MAEVKAASEVVMEVEGTDREKELLHSCTHPCRILDKVQARHKASKSRYQEQLLMLLGEVHRYR